MQAGKQARHGYVPHEDSLALISNQQRQASQVVNVHVLRTCQRSYRVRVAGSIQAEGIGCVGGHGVVKYILHAPQDLWAGVVQVRQSGQLAVLKSMGSLGVDEGAG
jgi:hypothetical protein